MNKKIIIEKMNQFQSAKDIRLVLMTNLEGSEYCNVWVASECRTLLAMECINVRR